jgi:hypothetical protein
LTPSSRAPAPVFNLLRRRFFTADPTDFTDYMRDGTLSEHQRAVKRKSSESAEIADNSDLMRDPCSHPYAYRLGLPLPL